MKKIPVRKFYKLGKAFLVKHSADILTGFTACGVVVTAIETHKATLKADEYLRKNGYDKANPETQKILKWESRKNYIIPILTGGATIGAAIGANYINHKQIAGLAAACTVAETALSEHRDKIEELMGEKGLAKIDDELMADKGRQIVSAGSSVIDTGYGDVLCIEGITGQLVRSSPEWFYRTANFFNQEVNRSSYASVAEYLQLLYKDCKGIYYIPDWTNYKGYNAYTTGLLEYCTPHWEGDASSEQYVVFTPTHNPTSTFMEIL